ncbi:hypothetical protein [Streptomyces sp. SID8016]|uniref:hypothetical protein n=1 Tax=Streptomyces sp. SID8016 TaxID=2706098 RepID=UPI0013DB645B|nr:hypothetical protein [Streptomyces sp. SID8016]
MSDYDDRLAEAEHAEADGRHRDAAHAYRRAGEASRTEHGQFDSRTLDAFEGMARVIATAGESEGTR